MPGYFIDTSALAKLYHIEVGSQKMEVTDMWASTPTEIEKQRAFKRVSGAPKEAVYLSGNVSEEAWSQLEAKYPGILLDTRERDEFVLKHHPSAINMPVDELESRVRHELDQDKPIIIDCTFEIEGRCRIAGTILSIMGFESVGILNPKNRGVCPAKS